MKVSLLDRSRTRAGFPEGAALGHSVERAVLAERLGYHRFWAAEHHGVAGVASGAPAVLLAAAGARTSSIRLGSGGVMLPHHQPLVVAEQFLMLGALYPGRVDLGLGRTLGFTQPVRQALRQESDSVEAFEADVAELRDYLQRRAAVTARPVTQGVPGLFLLATGRGTATAAALGLPVVLGGPVLHSPELPEILSVYRRDFQSSEETPAPVVIVSLDVFIADTRDQARDLALPEIWAMARSRETGEFGPLEPVAEINGQDWSRRTRQRVEESLDRAVAGTRSDVEHRLEQLVQTTGADELLVSTSTYDRSALAELDAELISLV